MEMRQPVLVLLVSRVIIVKSHHAQLTHVTTVESVLLLVHRFHATVHLVSVDQRVISLPVQVVHVNMVAYVQFLVHFINVTVQPVTMVPIVMFPFVML